VQSCGEEEWFVQEWAKNTGRWKDGDPEPNYAQLKTRLRCAFNKAPDIDEVKELHCTKSEEPYKVYRFTERRGESRLGPRHRSLVAFCLLSVLGANDSSVWYVLVSKIWEPSTDTQ